MAATRKGKAFKLLFTNLSNKSETLASKLTAPPLHHHYCSSSSSSSSSPTPPEPIPNRPLRGRHPTTNPNPNPNRRRRFGDDHPTPTATSTSTSIDDGFLERFKLRDEKVEKVVQVESNKKTTPPEAPTPPPPSSPPDADDIFRKMKETGLIPNAVAMLDGLCKDGLVQEAMKLFGLMREKGTIPEVVIYTAVVDGFCKAHKFDDAKRIFTKMQSNGISPNAFSYTIFIQGLHKGNCLDDALHFSLEMLQAGHSPNIPTFAALVDAFCRERGVEEARALIFQLRDKGFLLDDKGVREHLDKKGPFSPLVWEALFPKNNNNNNSYSKVSSQSYSNKFL
ncbi:hypothetical protein Syun_002825 [Stephania yunnanensis]|uniref:Pentatricopeptide repeat-containing protein n=1 Tax=Stephania yunnanensis TaxID=152371 RepID=A0AAP0L023_9MAGN